MKLVAEISMYPLNEVTSATSTLVSGDYLATMQVIAKEMQRSHQEVGQAIFVCKFLNGDKMSSDV